MKTKEEAIQYCAKRMFSNYMGGSNEYYIVASDLTWVYEDSEFNKKVERRFKQLVDQQVKKHKV